MYRFILLLYVKHWNVLLFTLAFTNDWLAKYRSIKLCFVNKDIKMIAKNILILRSLAKQKQFFCTAAINSSGFRKIMDYNREWSKHKKQNDPGYFERMKQIQKPKTLWISCSDSFVLPPNVMIGVKPGEIVTHRNFGNIVTPCDVNANAVVQYAVQHLEVTDIMIVGHYGCKAIHAAMCPQEQGALENWLSHLRQLHCKYRVNLVGSQQFRERTFVQLNITQQVVNTGKFAIVQNAWKEGKPLSIHGLVYNDHTGLLKDLGDTLSALEHIPQQFRVVTKQ